MSRDLGENYQTVAAWKRRGNIPAKYDLKVIAAAKSRGRKLSLEDLAHARAAATFTDAA
ncbi:hypothetical protein RISW2_22860 [Roseivivax isoporae LMG 25204]|uniref:Uncharacterized protein n=2 Tax=Roseivivax TaxID=93682 RepID=X7F3D9_9RHOB|nr:hypothetical protein RISW2_22860 [Roseivivax isoporae LMG 25204]